MIRDLPHVQLSPDFGTRQLDHLQIWQPRIFYGLVVHLSFEQAILFGIFVRDYIRPHMSLDGKTPSEMAGIKIEGDNKWVTLIQNASQQN